MISLLLTLFISLFSIGASVNTLEDPRENGAYNTSLVKSSYSSDENIYFISTETFNWSNFYSYVLKYGSSWSYNVRQDYDWNFYSTDTPNYIGNIGVTTLTTNQLHDLAGYTYSSVNRIRLTKYAEYDERTEYDLFLYYNSGSSFIRISYYVYYNQYNAGDPLYGTINVEQIIQNSGFINAGIVFKIDASYGGIIYDYFIKDTGELSNYNEGYTNGYDNGFSDGKYVGYQEGYGLGYSDGTDVDATASTIFTGILDIALIPVNVFLTIFNFEVFNINIGGIVSALLTVSVVVIIFRFVLGGKKDD